MKTSSGLKGAVVLSLALSLALPGGAWAKARPQGSEPVTGAQTGHSRVAGFFIARIQQDTST